MYKRSCITSKVHFFFQLYIYIQIQLPIYNNLQEGKLDEIANIKLLQLLIQLIL